MRIIAHLRADLYQDLHEIEWLGISLDGRTGLQTLNTCSRASQTIMPSHRAKGETIRSDYFTTEAKNEMTWLHIFLRHHSPCFKPPFNGTLWAISSEHAMVARHVIEMLR